MLSTMGLQWGCILCPPQSTPWPQQKPALPSRASLSPILEGTCEARMTTIGTLWTFTELEGLELLIRSAVNKEMSHTSVHCSAMKAAKEWVWFARWLEKRYRQTQEPLWWTQGPQNRDVWTVSSTGWVELNWLNSLWCLRSEMPVVSVCGLIFFF